MRKYISKDDIQEMFPRRYIPTKYKRRTIEYQGKYVLTPKLFSKRFKGIEISTKVKNNIKSLVGGCQFCNSTINLELHHINKDHFNNNPFNHAILCRKCHKEVHKLGADFYKLMPKTFKSWWCIVDISKIFYNDSNTIKREVI